MITDARSLAGGEKKNPRIGRIVLVESLAITCSHFDKKVISDRSFVARNKIFLEYNYDSEEQGIAQLADLLRRSGKTDNTIFWFRLQRCRSIRKIVPSPVAERL